MTVALDAVITPELVVLDLPASDRRATIEALAHRLVFAGRLDDLQGFVAAVLDREEETGGTGMESGIAIPHAKHAGVTEPSVVIGRVAGGGVDFGAEDALADLVFLVAAPAGADDLHVSVLSTLARRLVHESFRTALRDAPDPESIVTIIRGEVA